LLTVGTWENGRWVPVPSQIDVSRHVITARLSHASISGLLAPVKEALLGAMSPQARAHFNPFAAGSARAGPSPAPVLVPLAGIYLAKDTETGRAFQTLLHEAHQENWKSRMTYFRPLHSSFTIWYYPPDDQGPSSAK